MTEYRTTLWEQYVQVAALACRSVLPDSIPENEKDELNAQFSRFIRDQVRQVLQNVPVDILLNCPECDEPHVDKDGGMWEGKPWKNEPHRSHLCAHCGYIWRPADVPTNGVEKIETKGKHDGEHHNG